MKLKKLTKNLSLGQAKRRTALGFNILSDRGTVKVNVTEENSVMLKSFLDFLWNDALVVQKTQPSLKMRQW